MQVPVIGGCLHPPVQVRITLDLEQLFAEARLQDTPEVGDDPVMLEHTVVVRDLAVDQHRKTSVDVIGDPPRVAGFHIVRRKQAQLLAELRLRAGHHAEVVLRQLLRKPVERQAFMHMHEGAFALKLEEVPEMILQLGGRRQVVPMRIDMEVNALPREQTRQLQIGAVVHSLRFETERPDGDDMHLVAGRFLLCLRQGGTVHPAVFREEN